MNGSRWDVWTRRRVALATSGIIAALVGATPIPESVAKKKGKKGKKRKKRCCPRCAGKVCGADGCGGTCGLPCEQFKTCCQGICQHPDGTPGCCLAAGEVCTPDGGATFGGFYCCSKSCDTGAGHTNLCD
jgi:hypothetical protein